MRVFLKKFAKQDSRDEESEEEMALSSSRCLIRRCEPRAAREEGKRRGSAPSIAYKEMKHERWLS